MTYWLDKKEILENGGFLWIRAPSENLQYTKPFSSSKLEDDAPFDL